MHSYTFTHTYNIWIVRKKSQGFGGREWPTEWEGLVQGLTDRRKWMKISVFPHTSGLTYPTFVNVCVLECVQDEEARLSICLEIGGLALRLSIFFPEVFDCDLS